ncbi:alpha/beta fold hydrolase [Neoroseomonas oryzicola]|uniref:Alpha/beta hydrolase n=1 Tax=Neoroseomonas oryzicola TaxID=535904 RepID=A0A9X9WN35_9PROT|nr:alpha/beta hydrolase [Neoroseomonas oryzicola]NKE17325.1 alpha/beta hydrolase [Neoroseomonas oryzicola]
MTPRRVTVSARDGLALSALDWPGAPGRAPVLMLPGICRNALDASGLAARLAGRRRLVAFDYAGHGESERPSDPRRYQPELLIRDVIDMMAALHLHGVALVGTSFGGLASMAIAALRPASLQAVVLNDIGPRIEHVGRSRIVEFIGRDHRFPSFEAALAWYREHHPPMPLLDEDGWRGFAGRTYREGTDGTWHPRWDIRIAQQAIGAAAGPPPDLWPFFRGLGRLPLMLVWGEASTLLSADTVAEMQEMRPDMQVVSLPGTGHAPTLDEGPAAAAIDAFLEAVP